MFFSNGHSWNRCSTFVRKITREGAGGGVRFPTIFQRTHPVSSLYLSVCVAWIAWPPFKRSPRVSYKKLRGPEILVRRSNVGIARWKKPPSSFWGQRIISVHPILHPFLLGKEELGYLMWNNFGRMDRILSWSIRREYLIALRYLINELTLFSSFHAFSIVN